MDRHWYYVLFLLWFSYLIITQVLLFTNGFLLTRVAQFKNSSCRQIDDFQCGPSHQCDLSDYVLRLENASTTCLPPRSKVIVLLIDAFRYDFALQHDVLEPLPYQNKLPVISELVNKQPDNAKLFKFIADPPTTTMQRLKGLTTGSLPTFIDAGSNFATNEINEDNLIDQINNHGYNAIFMGDDTWNGLYPNRFKRNYPYPSFDVWDLDTVDYGVMKNLYPEIANNDWHLLIGHFLGVDHCGHRYGPDHPEMERKLTEVNGVIRKVIEQMDDKTVLFVIGDHGMTSTGDHGGDSENEITAAMFTYSKMKLSSTYYNHNKTIKQVDLVPTLAAILGIPIPYSNLGSVVYDVIPETYNLAPIWYHSLFIGWSNVQQITTYIREYASDTNTFDPEKLEAIYEKFSELNSKLHQVNNVREFSDFAVKMHDFIKSVRDMCEEVWIQFDAFSMGRGLLLLSHVMIFTYILIDGLSNEKFEEIVGFNFILLAFIGLLLAPVISAIFFYFQYIDNFYNINYFVAGLSGIVILSVVTVQNFQMISESFYEDSKTRRWPDIFSRIVIIFSAIMLLSNSFILEEAKVMMFFIFTSVLIIFIEYALCRNTKGKDLSFKGTNKILTVIFIVMCCLLRFTTYYWRCREEQSCDVFTKSNSGRPEWIMMAISLSLFVTGSRMWLRACGNLNGHSGTVLLARYLPTVSVVCSVGFWVLHKLPKDTKVKLLGPWQPDMLAWVVYVSSVAGIISVFVQPLCIFKLSKQLEVDTATSNVIPQLAKHVFTSKSKNDPPVVFGLATVYSAAFIIVFVNLVLLWSLLLGDIFVPSCIALVIVITLFLVSNSILQYEKATRIEDLLKTPSTLLLFWFVVTIYAFYSTGHQSAFPNIAWDAAFVGTGGKFVSNLIPATLIIFNTFGSQIIIGFALPLMFVAPFSLYVMYPNLRGKKGKIDLSRGEMILYDHNKLLLNNTFKLCCKYILCSVLRVFCSMLAATIHCRHLMVWNIFAPKLIFEGVGLIVTLTSVTFGYILLVRVNSRLDRFVKYLSKQHS